MDNLVCCTSLERCRAIAYRTGFSGPASATACLSGTARRTSGYPCPQQVSGGLVGRVLRERHPGSCRRTGHRAIRQHERYGALLCVRFQFFVERPRLNVVCDSVRVALSQAFGPPRHCPRTFWTGDTWDSWQWQVSSMTIQVAVNAQAEPHRFNQRDVPWVGVQFAQVALACGDWLPEAVPIDSVRRLRIRGLARASRSRRNVRQPNRVLADQIVSHKPQRRPRTSEVRRAATNHHGPEVKSILVDEPPVR